MKVLQFVEGGTRYGAAVSIRNLVLGLRDRGVDLHFCAFEGRPLATEMRDLGLSVTEIEVGSKFDPRAIKNLRRLFAAERIDLVHTHLSSATLIGSIASRLSRVPVVSTVHGMNRRWTYSFSNRIITVSKAAKEHLVAQGVRASKISVVYNGIPVPDSADLICKESARAGLGIASGVPVFGTVSRASLNKGIQYALQATRELVATHPNVQYLFVGEGKHLADFKLEAERLGIQSQVQFLGFQEDVFGSLRAMDVFVLPSLAEAMGISIVEAMAAERPVVATTVGGIPEVVTSETGTLVPPRDATAIATACRAMFDDPVGRESFGKNARLRVEKLFTVPVSAEAVEAVYNRTFSEIRTR